MKGIFKIASCIALLSTTGMSTEIINQMQLGKIGSELEIHSLTEVTYGALFIIDNYEKEWQDIKSSQSEKGWLNNISPELFQRVNEIYTQSTFVINKYSNLYSEIYITKLQTLVNEIEQALIDKETTYVQKRAAEWENLRTKLDFQRIIASRSKEIDDPTADKEAIEQEEIISKIYNDLQEWIGFLYEDYSEDFIERNLKNLVDMQERVSEEIETDLKYIYGE